ncbi:hypothetical protein [Agilicoccus flavus]|uniref:hypothetical protein n=1 Tax=Agilicoccus flavus TaxID=2775968 RepID=UPI001CF6506E|nr:hypothetical protein [Agilicoccus flavus]
MSAVVEITTEGIPPEDLSGARIMLGDTELGRFDGQPTVRFEVSPGRHVLIIRDGFGLTAAMRFRVVRGQLVRLCLALHEPENWGLVFGGYHVLQRAGTERISS